MINTKIPLYGLFLLMGIICGMIVSYKNAKFLKIDKIQKIALIIYIFLGTIYGGKYFTYFTHLSEYEKFDFMKLGFSSYGEVIGILILLFIYSKQYKVKYKELIQVIIPGISLMYSFGKIGCFLAGCCHGIVYSGLFSITYRYSIIAPNGVGLFPVQLIEAILFMIIFIVLEFLFIKAKTNYLIGLSFIVCGFTKFILDYFRISHSDVLLSINQIVSLIFILIGFFIIVIKYKNKILKS